MTLLIVSGATAGALWLIALILTLRMERERKDRAYWERGGVEPPRPMDGWTRWQPSFYTPVGRRLFPIWVLALLGSSVAFIAFFALIVLR